MRYLVRVGSGLVGAVTDLGVVAAVERVGVETFVVRFASGESKRFRLGQAVVVIDDD